MGEPLLTHHFAKMNSSWLSGTPPLSYNSFPHHYLPHTFFNSWSVQSSLKRFFQNVLLKDFVIYLFTYFWLCWVFVAECRLSLVSESGGCSPVVMHGLLTDMTSLA